MAEDAGPVVPPMPAAKGVLDQEYARRLAEYWYGTYGPHRMHYAMVALHAYENQPAQWSVKFETEPTLGTIYFRRFHYSKTPAGGWECEKMTEDPEHPEHVDYDPDDNDSEDDLETLEEEERLAKERREDDGDEVEDLNADNDLSIEELMAKYAALEAAQQQAAGGAAAAGESSEAGAAGAAVAGSPRKRGRSDSDGNIDAAGAEGAASAKHHKNERGEAVAAGAGGADQSPFAPGRGILQGDKDARRFSILEYFSPENHEEDLEFGTRKLEPKVLRIGAEYQALRSQLPTAKPDWDSAKLAASSCSLAWSPCPAEAESACAQYAEEVVKGRERPTLPLEAALRILHELQFDTAEAMARFQKSYQGVVPFTYTERAGFERGLLTHGKNFGKISRDFIPTRTVKETVSFYYNWKRTEHYDEFIARNWSYGPSKFRRKHLLEPSHDVEEFDQQPIPKECVTSPGDTGGFDTTDCSPLDVAAADYSLDVDAIT